MEAVGALKGWMFLFKVHWRLSEVMVLSAGASGSLVTIDDLLSNRGRKHPVVTEHHVSEKR